MAQVHQKLPALIAVFCLLSAASVARAQSRRHSFEISSMGTAFGVQADFLGTYQIDEDAVRVHISSGSLYASEDCPYEGRRRIIAITFGLAHETRSGKWRVQTLAQPVALTLVMRPGETRVLKELDFAIPRATDIDLMKHWLVVAVKEEILDPPGSATSPLRGTNFAHSCKDIFAPNFDPLRRQPNVPFSGAPRYCR
jgi:hypothetical protein